MILSRKSLLTRASLAVVAALIVAPVAQAAAPKADAAITVPPIAYKTRTLKNGMKVYWSRDTTTPKGIDPRR